VWACTLDLTDCGVRAPKVNVNRSDRPPGIRFNTLLGVADMANPTAVAGLGKVTTVKTPAGATIHVLPTETGSILVGKNASGGELTVLVQGPKAIALTLGDVYDALGKGLGGLKSLLGGCTPTQTATATYDKDGKMTSFTMTQTCKPD
jgi:hypothetical protein